MYNCFPCRTPGKQAQCCETHASMFTDAEPAQNILRTTSRPGHTILIPDRGSIAERCTPRGAETGFDQLSRSPGKVALTCDILRSSTESGKNVVFIRTQSLYLRCVQAPCKKRSGKNLQVLEQPGKAVGLNANVAPSDSQLPVAK